MLNPSGRAGHPRRLLCLSLAVALAALYHPRTATGSLVPRVTLNNGVQLPMVSAGLYEVTVEETSLMIPTALDVGIDAFDASCLAYGNQHELGHALEAYDRGRYFLTTKLDPLGGWNQANAYNNTLAQLDSCLTSHRVDVIDLLLVHYPKGDCATIQTIWRAVESFYNAGKAKSVGVSHFYGKNLKCLMDKAAVTPAVNQVRASMCDPCVMSP